MKAPYSPGASQTPSADVSRPAKKVRLSQFPHVWNVHLTKRFRSQLPDEESDELSAQKARRGITRDWMRSSVFQSTSSGKLVCECLSTTLQHQSNSPLNDEGVDALIKAMETMTMSCQDDRDQDMWCTHCEMWLNGSAQMDTHNRGRKHFKNTSTVVGTSESKKCYSRII